MLARSEHLGPLRVQRAFYPEASGACHVYMLHPPGGVAGGDQLEIAVRVDSGAHALITTPGAGKLYRTRGPTASLSQRLTVASGALLEWFPQENIVFNGAAAQLDTRVELEPGAAYAGWEIVCFGRPACGERFERGVLDSAFTLSVGPRTRYLERGYFAGGDPVMSEPWGLGGNAVLGLFSVAHEAASEDWVEQVRAAVEPEQGLFAVTLLQGLLLGRYLGPSTLDARATFERMFAVLRPLYASAAAVTPRIWRT